MKIEIQKQLSLFQNFSWTFIGNVVYAISQWGIIVVLSKFGNVMMVGQYAIGLAVTAPIILFANLKLRDVQATDASSKFRFGEYLGLRLSMMVFAAAIILFSLFSFGYERETALIIFVIGLCKITESLSDIIFGRLQKEKRLDRIALSLIFQGPISLVLFSILLWLTGSLLFGLLGIFISRLSLLIVYDIANVKKYARFHPNFSLQTLTHLFKFSIPLGFVQLFISLYLNIPRYFLESYHGEEILGYFSAIAYILVAGDTIISALSQAASPQLANLFHLGKKRSFLRLFMRLVLIAIGLGFAGILFIFLFGPEILLILYQADYMQFNNIFLLLMFASTLNYVGWFMEAAMTATGRFKEQLYISFLWVITSVISSILLIPDLGIKGAAYALIITASVQLLSKLLVLILIYKSERTN